MQTVDARRMTEDGPSPTEQNRTMLNAYLKALLSGGDYGAHLVETVTFTIMDTGEVTQGREAVVGLIDFMHTQAFAATPTVRSLIVDGGHAALEAEFVATHVGEFAGVSATGRQVSVPYAIAYDLDGGSISALRMYMSMDSLIRQIREG